MPTKTELSKFSIRGEVTESGTNTFTEQALSTNLVAQGDAMFMATGLWMFLDTNGALLNSDELEFQITYSSQAGIIKPSDPDWIWGRNWYSGPTSGAVLLEKTTYVDIDHFPLATPQIYLGIKGVSLANAATGAIKLSGYLQKVSTTDFFRIANLR